ncbi:MAG: hypothetical protein IPM26_14260 [Saprospiraceae bacterium]|nr:hypothetical protein [Saprospiraceae bacterium]
MNRHWLIFQSTHWGGKLLVGLIFLLTVLYFNRWTDTVGGCDDKFWELIDPVSAITTFMATLFIYYNQAKQRWEDSLEKLLDIEYYYTQNGVGDSLLAEIKGAYLAGASDIRQWAISLGGQLFGQIKFDINWDDDTKPEVIKAGNKYVKQYKIKMYLTAYPDKISLPSTENLKYSVVEGGPDNLPIRWIRK